jgi:class 3 adenylate cyclase
MGTAGPDEILTSETVRDLIVGSNAVLEDRGTQPLKGIEGTWRLSHWRACSVRQGFGRSLCR